MIKKIFVILSVFLFSSNLLADKENTTFFFNINKGIKNEVYFSKKPLETDHVLREVSVSFFKEGILINKIPLGLFLEPITLDFGQYDILVAEKNRLLLKVENFTINKESGKYLNIRIKPTESFVEGVLKVEDMYLGGADVLFTDVKNNTYTLTSDFSGKFSGNLPPQKYRISIKKFGYNLKEENQLLYDFSNENETFTLNLELEEAPSFIELKVLDDRGLPVREASVIIKNGEESQEIFSDNYGRIKGVTKPGLVLIRVEKNGFHTMGIVRRIEKFSTVSNLEIKLARKLFKINGILSDGITPIKSQQMDLITSSGRRFASTLSGENGYFEFLDIPTTETFKITVNRPEYKPYFSDDLLLKENLNNFNIFMRNKSNRVILEVTDEKGNHLANENFTLDSTPLSTDSNGITYYSTDLDILNLFYKKNITNFQLDEEMRIYKIEL